MRQSVTYKEKSEGFANQTFRLLLVGRSRSGFSSPDSDTYYTLGLAVETIAESSMAKHGQAVSTYWKMEILYFPNTLVIDQRNLDVSIYLGFQD